MTISRSCPISTANRGDYKILSWDLEPGDLVAHHVMNVHGAPENTADIRRRGLAIRWIGGEAAFDPRPETQPLLRAAVGDGPTPHKDGQALGGETYPGVPFPVGGPAPETGAVTSLLISGREPAELP